jgi:hypothetical protein
MVQKVIMTIGLSTDPGNESDLSRWYREVHIPEARRLMPGTVGVTFYENLKPDKDSPCILAIWEFESEDAVKAVENNQARNFTPGPKYEMKLFNWFRRVDS